MADIINLTQYRIIEASGADAEKYLQGQLTCDVSKLEIGQSTVTAHCDPKGKVSSIFRLIRLAAEQFYLLIRVDLLPEALEQLKKYAVFSKITFSYVDAQVVGIIGENTNISAQIQLKLDDRYLLINPQSAVNFNADFTIWDLADIQAGYPILTNKMQHEFIPQALNLQCLEQAISFHKGCYIGQETVARAKYRGANKRAMYALKAQTDGTAEIGSELEMQLESGWRKTGVILNAVNVNGELWLQAVMNNQLEDSVKFRLPENGTALEIFPLPYSLEDK